MSDLVVSVSVLPTEKHVEVSLDGRFTRAELDVVRGLAGRRWDGARRVWIVPGGDEVVVLLRERFGTHRVRSTAAQASKAPRESRSDLLDRVRATLALRGYSLRTAKVYLAHLRHFLASCDGSQGRPYDWGAAAQSYIVQLVNERAISRSYHNQLVSAVRFLCEVVLEQPTLALRVPRPRREHSLPIVLSPEEVAAMLESTSNPKHRALLMVLYSAGLRVSEVARLRIGDLDIARGLVRVRRGKGGQDRYTLLARRAVDAVQISRRVSDA